MNSQPVTQPEKAYSLFFVHGFLRLLACLFLLVGLRMVPALAEGAVTITSCTLSSSSRLKVVAECDPAAVSGKKCYLFALPFSGGKITAKSVPLSERTKAAVMRFSVKIPKSKRQEYLYCRFVVAEKHSGKYRVISDARYVTNPGKTAKLKYAFPQATSKKGLQVSEEMVEDAVELNVQHSVLNIVLSSLPASGNRHNTKDAIPYNYQGKTYWMNRDLVESYDRQLQALQLNRAVVSAVLLVGYRNGYTGLIHPKARKKGKDYTWYAWNMSSAKAREAFQAMLSFLAERYCAKDAKYGRIANWIVGNEVESAKDWNYCGGMSLGPYMANYAKQFRLVYTAVTSVYSNARVYISLSHLWNKKLPGGFTARETLDAFVSALSAQGYIPWNLAYHPYSSPLTEPRFWENKNQMLTAALTSPVINMGNLSVLTSYIKETYGSGTRVILSEQGFTSLQDGKDTQAEQSAAIAYSYLLTEGDDMVDSFIMNRHVDNTVETSLGLNLGLWTTSRKEWADKKKSSWDVFKYMDTGMSEKFTNAALSVIDVEKWADVVANYSPVLYEKVNLVEGSLQIVGGYTKKKKAADKWLSYGAAGKLSVKKNAFSVTHDGSRNAHSHWGFIQNFRKKLNMGACPAFCLKLKVSGSQSPNVLVKMRFYSGRNEFECAQVIPRGVVVALRADLSGWEFRSSISRIIIALEPISGGWKGKAKLTMERPVLGG